MRAYLYGVASGFVACVILAAFIVTCTLPKRNEAAHATSRAISGEAAKVTKTETKSDGVHQTAEYSGAGKTEIVTPFSAIPPADNWINKRSSVMFYYSARDCLMPVYSYRYEYFILSGGARVPVRRFLSFRDYDFFGGAGVCF